MGTGAARRAVTWIVRLALLTILALVAFALTVLIVLPRTTDAVSLTVLTGSMSPSIPAGSIVLVRPVEPTTLRVGDIATYQATPGKAEYITHRIVKINTDTKPATFTFKGDANRGADLSRVPATAIRGKVWFHVPYLGTVRNEITGRSIVLPVVIGALLAYALAQVIAAVMTHRRSTATAEPMLVEVLPDPTEEVGR